RAWRTAPIVSKSSSPAVSEKVLAPPRPTTGSCSPVEGTARVIRFRARDAPATVGPAALAEVSAAAAPLSLGPHPFTTNAALAPAAMRNQSRRDIIIPPVRLYRPGWSRSRAPQLKARLAPVPAPRL